jgi:hypothetical protein
MFSDVYYIEAVTEGMKSVHVKTVFHSITWWVSSRFIPKYKKTMHFLVDGLEKTHKVYQDLIEAHPEEKQDNFIGAFVREQRTRGSDLGTFTQPQFHYLLADLFGAGADTTLTTLRWFLIYVASNHHVQVHFISFLSLPNC